MALKKNPKYDIKRKYFRILQISIIVSLSLLILAFKFFPNVSITTIESNPFQELTKVVYVPPTENETVAPEPPKPRIPIENPTDELLEDFDIKPTDLDVNAVVAKAPPNIKNDDAVPDVIFVAVEKMPEPVGGIGAIQKKIIYPEFAIKAGIQGKVHVKAFVDENGNVFKVELVRGIGGGCDEVAMEAVKNSDFIPGKQRGRAVKVQVGIPIVFKLQ
jgi:protein TonB